MLAAEGSSSRWKEPIEFLKYFLRRWWPIKEDFSYPLDQGVCHIVALPFTLKGILMQNKNYKNSNNFTMQKVQFPRPIEIWCPGKTVEICGELQE
jgi:hypothetical protein